MDGLARRYPSVDQEESADEYFQDFKRLALKHGVGKVAEAMQALRIDPDQHFFPRPDEVAAEIRRIDNKALPSHLYARQ